VMLSGNDINHAPRATYSALEWTWGNRSSMSGWVCTLGKNIRPRKPCAQWQQELRPLGLIIFTMHHQHRQRDVLQVVGKIRLREGDDAVVVRFRAPESGHQSGLKVSTICYPPSRRSRRTTRLARRIIRPMAAAAKTRL